MQPSRLLEVQPSPPRLERWGKVPFPGTQTAPVVCYTVLKEQPLPKRRELRPANLLVIGYGPRPLAIDFTVVTPVRPSALRVGKPLITFQASSVGSGLPPLLTALGT